MAEWAHDNGLAFERVTWFGGLIYHFKNAILRPSDLGCAAAAREKVGFETETRVLLLEARPPQGRKRRAPRLPARSERGMLRPMEYQPTRIPDVVLCIPKVFGDERGFFLETFRASEFEVECARTTFVQDNHSKSTRGILRGLHYQNPKPQGKLVRVVEGEVFDVAVDMRRSSPTFGKWVGATLSAENKHMLWVPPGFAHGFYVTSDTAEFVYKCDDYYAPAHEQSLLWNDPAVGIEWPLDRGGEPRLSDKDAAGATLRDSTPFD